MCSHVFRVPRGGPVYGITWHQEAQTQKNVDTPFCEDPRDWGLRAGEDDTHPVSTGHTGGRTDSARRQLDKLYRVPKESAEVCQQGGVGR
jgi:hypothetical protein